MTDPQKSIQDIILNIAQSATHDSPVDGTRSMAGHLNDMGALLEGVLAEHPEHAEKLAGLLDQTRDMSVLAEQTANAMVVGDFGAADKYAQQVRALSGMDGCSESLAPGIEALEDALFDGDESEIRAAARALEDINTTDTRYGLTPLCLELTSEDRTQMRTQFFLGLGARADLASADGYTPLHAIADYSYSPDDEAGAITKLLVAHGADIEARDSFGRTPLLRAVVEGSADEMSALLEVGADPSAALTGDSGPCFHPGQTALMLAAAMPDKFRLLLERGAVTDDALTEMIDVKLSVAKGDYPEFYTALRQSRDILKEAQQG